MNKKTAHILSQMNTRFYQRVHASFSETRGTSWQGWDGVIEALGDRSFSSVLDVACGNLRFERHLRDAYPGRDLALYAVDNCDELLVDVPGVRYQHLDLVEALIEGNSLRDSLECPPCDLVVSFGFMHHVPSYEARAALMRALVAQTRAGGFMAVSFWRFLDDPRLARKAHSLRECVLAEWGIDLSELEEGDCFLGWKSEGDAYRYCHHFTEEEIDALLREIPEDTQVVARFRADGQSGTLNEYVVLGVLR